MNDWIALSTLVPILGFWASIRRHWSFGPAPSLLLAVSSILLVLYLGGLLGLLWWTALAVYALGTIMAALHLVESARDRRLAPPPVPIGVFLVVVVLFWLLHRESQYFFYDEYSHWGIFLKEMQAGDRYWGASSSAMHPRYVPGPALWQYFFGVFSRQHTDGIAYLAQFVLLISPIMVLWERLRWSQPLWILGVVLLVLVGFASFSPGIASLYVDHVLSTWFLGTILCFMVSDDRRLSHTLVFAVPLVGLVLIKEAGLAFSLSAAAIITALAWRARSRPGKSLVLNATWSLLVFVALVVPGAVAYQSWQLNRDALGVAHSSSSVSGVIDSVAGPGEPDQQLRSEISRRFSEVVLHQQLVKNATSWQFNAFSYPLRSLYNDRFRLTMSALVALFVAWQLFLLNWFVKGEDRWRLGIVCLGMLGTTAGYVGMLHVNYTASMGEYGLALSSILRYLHTMALPLFIVGFVPLLPAFRTGQEPSGISLAGRSFSKAALAFAGLLVAFIAVEHPYLKPLLVQNQRIEARAATDGVAAEIRMLAGSGRIWVYLPNDQPNEFIGRFLQFQLSPVPATVERSPSFFTQDSSQVMRAWSAYSVVWFAAGVPDVLLEGRIDRIDGSATVYRVVSDAASTRLEPVDLQAGKFGTR